MPSCHTLGTTVVTSQAARGATAVPKASACTSPSCALGVSCPLDKLPAGQRPQSNGATSHRGGEGPTGPQLRSQGHGTGQRGANTRKQKSHESTSAAGHWPAPSQEQGPDTLGDAQAPGRPPAQAGEPQRPTSATAQVPSLAPAVPRGTCCRFGSAHPTRVPRCRHTGEGGREATAGPSVWDSSKTLPGPTSPACATAPLPPPAPRLQDSGGHLLAGANGLHTPHSWAALDPKPGPSLTAPPRSHSQPPGHLGDGVRRGQDTLCEPALLWLSWATLSSSPTLVALSV